MHHAVMLAIPVFPPCRFSPSRRHERYAARLEALAHRSGTVTPRLWTGLVSAALGLALGVLGSALYAPIPLAPVVLTPQQQTIYDLVQDLAQTSTPDQAWVIYTRLHQVMKSLHPQPRPRAESLLPTQRAFSPRE